MRSGSAVSVRDGRLRFFHGRRLGQRRRKGWTGRPAAAPRSRSSSDRAVQKDVPVDLAAIGNVEAYSTISVRSQVTGALERPCASTKATSSRPATAAVHDRSAAVRGGAARRPRRTWCAIEALLDPGRSAAGARRRQRGVHADRRPSASAARPARASSRRIRPSRRVAAAAPPRRSSRPTRRPSRARRRSSSRSRRGRQREGSSSTTPSSRRRSTAGPATSASKVGNLVTANQTELMTIAQVAAGLRHLHGAGHPPRRRSSGTWPAGNARRHRDAAGRRRRSRRPACSPSSTTPSTRRPTRSS